MPAVVVHDNLIYGARCQCCRLQVTCGNLTRYHANRSNIKLPQPLPQTACAPDSTGSLPRGAAAAPSGCRAAPPPRWAGWVPGEQKKSVSLAQSQARCCSQRLLGIRNVRLAQPWSFRGQVRCCRQRSSRAEVAQESCSSTRREDMAPGWPHPSPTRTCSSRRRRGAAGSPPA